MEPTIIAGPCAVESKEQILDLAHTLKGIGVKYLRGGAYKPRTSPESFQGLKEKGLQYLAEAKAKTGLKVVTEVVSIDDIERIAEVADVLQIGSRNMHNYDLLTQIGKRAPSKTVLLKRGMQATKQEVLGAIGYLRSNGHLGRLYVCERGIRTFANGEYDRFTMDTSLIADLKQDPKFEYEVIVDPSHPAGRNELVAPLAYAGIAAGGDGLIIEVKRDNDAPLSDAKQAITIEQLKEIMHRASGIYKIVKGDTQ